MEKLENLECPICGLFFPRSVISAHADRCLDETDIDGDGFTSDVTLSPDSKRIRVEQAKDVTFSPVLARCSSPTFGNLTLAPLNTERTAVSVAISTDSDSLRHASAQNMQSESVCLNINKSENVKMTSVYAIASQTLRRNSKSVKILDFFTGTQKSVQPKQVKSARGSMKDAAANPPSSQSGVQQHVKLAEESLEKTAAGDVSDTLLCNTLTTKESKSVVSDVSHNSALKISAQSSTVLTYVPLAERMRPTVLADFVGQGHVVGSQRPLRSLLESTSVVSMILWGPPGCGKVTVSCSIYVPHCVTTV